MEPSELVWLVVAVSFVISFLAFCAIVQRLVESVEEIAAAAKRENKAHTTAVETGLVSDGDVLPLGLYQPNEEDANQYLFDKVDELRAARSSPYVGWDWSSGDEEEEH